MVSVDKRLEFLEALVIACKQVNATELNDELDFVEYYNIPYVKELVNRINIKKYPEVVDYINDIKDCGYYTNLFLYFDEQFNLYEYVDFQPFKYKNVVDFAKIIKKIYINERIDEAFEKYDSYLNSLKSNFECKYRIDFKERLMQLYGIINGVDFSTKISLLINGGFSSKRDNTVSYIKGIKVNDNIEDIVFSEYTIVCLYHEYSHFFVNDLIDKYIDNINNIDILYNESLENGLPKTYQNIKALLYEYFVRANSLILSENQISKKEYDENIEWYKEIGFVRIEEFINLIKDGLLNNMTFEDIFKTYIIDYFNNINMNRML